jgi:hypothetical protein
MQCRPAHHHEDLYIFRLAISSISEEIREIIASLKSNQRYLIPPYREKRLTERSPSALVKSGHAKANSPEISAPDGHMAIQMNTPRPIFAGRYLDRFERRNGEWRISRRIYVADWQQSFEVDATAENQLVSGINWSTGLNPTHPWYRKLQ